MKILNLMPPERKVEIAYARRNRRLLRWVAATWLVIIAMGATVLLGGFYIDSSKRNLSSSIDQSKQEIATEKLDQVQKDAEDLSKGVKLIVQILSKEVEFSKLLAQVGAIMPPGTILGDVQLSNKVDGAIDLTANAIDEKSATQVQVNLQNSKQSLFEKVDTISVACEDGSSNNAETNPRSSRYKCEITVRALFKKDAAVTFTGSSPTASPTPSPGGTR